MKKRFILLISLFAVGVSSVSSLSAIEVASDNEEEKIVDIDGTETVINDENKIEDETKETEVEKIEQSDINEDSIDVKSDEEESKQNDKMPEVDQRSTVDELVSTLNSRGFTTSVDGNTVTVTGEVTDDTTYLQLNVDAGIELIWKAKYSGTAISDFLLIEGDGKLYIEEGADISSDNNGSVLVSSVDTIMNGGKISGKGSNRSHITVRIGYTSSFRMNGGLIESERGNAGSVVDVKYLDMYGGHIISRERGTNGVIMSSQTAVLNMYDGIIETAGGTSTALRPWGTVNVYGGVITASGGGASSAIKTELGQIPLLYNEPTINMYGGQLIGDSGGSVILAENKHTQINMSGGQILNISNGRGIFLSSLSGGIGYVKVSGGVILSRSAEVILNDDFDGPTDDGILLKWSKEHQQVDRYEAGTSVNLSLIEPDTATTVWHKTTDGKEGILCKVNDAVEFIDLSDRVSVYSNPIIHTESLPTGTIGVPYSTQIEATGDSALTYSALLLPTGLKINKTTGVISGTPTKSGTSVVTVTVKNATGETATKIYSLKISALPEINTTTLPNGKEGDRYRTEIEGTGTAPMSYSATGLPSGLTISSNGIISGTPTQTGDFNVTVKLMDAVGEATKTYTLTVLALPKINTTALPDGKEGDSYRTEIEGTGTAPMSYSATGLPSGLTISSDGIISGTPTQTGDFNVTVKLMDAVGEATKTYTLTILALPKINTTALPDGKEGDSYRTEIEGTGTAPMSYSATGLPSGLTISSDGIISGTPTQTGDFNVTVKLMDAVGEATKTYTLTILALPEINTTALPNGKEGDSYRTEIEGTGTAPMSYSATGLPKGLTISSNGIISGTPTQTGDFNVTVKLMDAVGEVTKTYVLKILEKDEIVLPDNDELICAKDFKIHISKVDGLTDESIIKLSEAQAQDLTEEKSIEVFVKESKIEKKVGTYNVTLTTEKGSEITVQATVYDKDDDGDILGETHETNKDVEANSNDEKVVKTSDDTTLCIYAGLFIIMSVVLRILYKNKKENR